MNLLHKNRWIFRCATVAFIVVLLAAISNDLYAEVLWSTGHETGDLSDWCSKDQGGECVFNSGGSDASVTVTSEAAHTGNYAIKMAVWNIDTQLRACRIFRWAEYLTEGYYSCWFMFPTLPIVIDWLNIFQFKKTDGAATDPTWYNEARNKPGGTVLTLTHWLEESDIPPNVNPSPALSPGEWFHVEWYYKDGINDGEIRIWINGLKIWHLQNINTRGINPFIQWSPCLYGENVSPSYLVLYMDDAVISTVRVGPNFFGSETGSSIGGGAGCFISTIMDWIMSRKFKILTFMKYPMEKDVSDKSKKLSIIIVKYNTKRLLQICLKSIYDTARNLCFGVFIVDNASSDGSAEMVKTHFPQVRPIF